MTLRGSRRERLLASDSRAGRYPRELAKARRREYRRRVGVRLLIPIATTVLLLLMVTALLVWAFHAGQFELGLVVGIGLAVIWYEMRSLIRESSGSVTAEMGGQGELWTARELRKLSSLGWRVVNHVQLRQRDIDHVLVGPGGVYAIESKWKSDLLRLSPIDPWIAEAARQARANANDLTLWHELKSLGVGDVHPVVFFWGPGSSTLPDTLEVNDATVVKGSSSKEWRTALTSGALDGNTIEKAWVALDKQCRLRDA